MADNRPGEHIATVISVTELGYAKPSWEDVRVLIRTLNRDAALVVLAQFNLFLAVSSIQSQQAGNMDRRRWVQERLIANIVSVERLEELKAKLGSSDLVDRVLVHRNLVMVLIRLVAGESTTSGGNVLVERDDFNVLGELALLINALVEPAPGRVTPCDLAAQLSPTREIENHPDLGSTLARMSRLLDTHLPVRASMPESREIASRAEQVFTFVSGGFSFRSFRDVTFALFAHYSTLDLEKALRDQGLTYFNPQSSGHFISTAWLERFFARVSVEVRDLAAHLAEGLEDDRKLLDVTPFRTRPFWKFANDSYLCVDPALLMEMLAEGTFHWIMGGLDDAARRGQFLALWGHMFEDYVVELLAYSKGPAPAALHVRPFFERPNEEAFDAMVVEGADVVVMQVKGAFLPRADKYSGDGRLFFKGLTRRFGKHPGAAVEQLVRNIAHAFASDRSRRTVRDVELKAVRTVFPVAVVQEPTLGFWLAAQLMAARFAHRIRTIKLVANTHIAPLVFITVEELERLVEHVKAGDFTWAEILKAKTDDDPDNLLSVQQHLDRIRKVRGLRQRRNGLLAAEWKRFEEEALHRFATGVYR